ncbi:hypothetical protein ACP4OV_011195 [Aristida adscensionis]
MCPGNDLAKLEISVFLHHFLLGYNPIDKDKSELSATISSSPKAS